MAPEAVQWESLKGITKEDYAAKLGKKELDPFLKNPEFQKAVNTGSLFEKPVIEPKLAAAEPVVIDPARPAPKIESKDTSSDPLWKRRGYDSEETFEKAIGDLEVAKLEKERLAKEAVENKNRLDRLNADRGREGLAIKKELDKVAADKAKMQKELDDLRAAATHAKASVDIPKMPAFDISAISDPETHDKFNQSVEEFNVKMESSFEALRKKNLELEEALKANAGKVDNFDAFSQNAMRRQQIEIGNRALDDVFSEAVKLQGKYPELKTECSLTDINGDTVKIRDGNMTVEDFQKKYKPEDVAKYEKMVGYIRNYRDFDERGNIVIDTPKHVRSLEALYIDDVVESGQLESLINRIKIEAGTAARGQVLEHLERINDTAVGLPTGGEQRDLPKNETQLEEVRKLELYVAEGLINVERDPAKAKDYMRLAVKYGAGIPKSWAQKFVT